MLFVVLIFFKMQQIFLSMESKLYNKNGLFIKCQCLFPAFAEMERHILNLSWDECVQAVTLASEGY